MPFGWYEKPKRKIQQMELTLTSQLKSIEVTSSSPDFFSGRASEMKAECLGRWGLSQQGILGFLEWRPRVSSSQPGDSRTLCLFPDLVRLCKEIYPRAKRDNCIYMKVYLVTLQQMCYLLLRSLCLCSSEMGTVATVREGEGVWKRAAHSRY